MPAGGVPPERAAGRDRARILVGFVETLPEEELRREVRALGGEIVGGLSSIGLYTVEVPVPEGDRQRLETLLRDLRRRGEVVRFAEPAP